MTVKHFQQHIGTRAPWTQKAVLNTLTVLAGEDGIASPSIGTLSRATGMHYTVVHHSIDALRDAGIITVHKTAAGFVSYTFSAVGPK